MQRKFLRKFLVFISAACLTAASFTGCGSDGDKLNSYDELPGDESDSRTGGGAAGSDIQGGAAGSDIQGGAGEGSTGPGSQGGGNNMGGNGVYGTEPEADNSQVGTAVSGTVQNAAAENVLVVEEMFSDRDLTGDYKESESIAVTLNGGTAQCSSKNVTISGSTVTIKAEGTYILSGTLDDGMIIVEADEKAKVQLVLKNASISNSGNAAIYVRRQLYRNRRQQYRCGYFLQM